MNFLNVLGLNNNNKDDYQNEEAQENKEDVQKTTNSTSHSYFEKKGEVNELRKIFRELMEKSPVSNEELRGALKKLISILTLGIDLSSIFTEVLMFSYTDDIISKKMIYLYLANYAKTNKETAIMAINTFMKDCRHIEGKIRGLALKTLCSLQISTALEYVKQQVLILIDDKDYYVRKIAVMGCLRLYYFDHEFFKTQNLIDKLYNLLKDPHKSVVMCSINVLNEIMIEEGGMAINSKIILYLMNRFEDFDVYGKQTILGLLIKYRPKKEKELFDLMNLLEDNLKQNHIPLCMSIINVFIEFTKNKPKIFEQVKKHISPKFLMMLSSSEEEELYNILQHILFFMKSSAKDFFRTHYKMFYCRANDRNYNQKLKIKILVELADKNNINDIIEEFSEYAGEKDHFFSKYAIEGLGDLLKKFPDKSVVILKRLLIFIKLGKITTIKIILNVLKDIVGYIKNIPTELASVFDSFLDEEIEEKTAEDLLVIIGQIPNEIEVAPYLVEHILNLILEKKIQPHKDINLHLLNSIVRIFLKRPGESLIILTKVFNYIFSENGEFVKDVDLIERASFYYNLLKHDIDKLKEIVEINIVDNQESNNEQQFLEEIAILGLNDLRIIYNQSASQFIKPFEFFNKNIKKETVQETAESAEEENDEDEDQDQDEEEEDDQGEEEEFENDDNDKKEILNKNEINFLDVANPRTKNKNDINFLEGSEEKTSFLTEENFDNLFELDQEDFQEYWLNWQNELTEELTLIVSKPEANFYEKVFSSLKFYSIAVGEEENIYKYYLFAKKVD
jgi:AP-4 complex subunit beta-1